MSIKKLLEKYFEAHKSLYTTSDPIMSRNELVRCLKRLVEEHPNCKDGWLMFGDVSLNRRLSKRAYRKALALYPGDLEANVALAQMESDTLVVLGAPANKNKMVQYLNTALMTLENYPIHRDASYCLDRIMSLSHKWRLRKMCAAAVEIGIKHLGQEQDWSELPKWYSNNRRKLKRRRRAKQLRESREKGKVG